MNRREFLNKSLAAGAAGSLAVAGFGVVGGAPGRSAPAYAADAPLAADRIGCIRQAYRDLLFRDADADGLRYYDGSEWPLPWIKQHLLQGREFAGHPRNQPTGDARRDMVRRLYWAIYGRQPAQSEWDSAVRGGLSEALLASQLLGSPENWELRRDYELGNPYGQPTFKFPWRGERVWQNGPAQKFTGGPHAPLSKDDPGIGSPDVPPAQRSGIDFGSPGRFTVYAAAPGIVRSISPVVGETVVIDHGHDWETHYWHLGGRSISVRSGQYVGWGTPIATSSNTGCPGCSEHLHLELRAGGQRHFWQGKQINGWRVETGVNNYDGKLVHPHADIPDAVADQDGNTRELYSDNIELP